jgi:hypothetical protein
MAVNANPSEIDSLLRELLSKLSSSLAECRVNINSLKHKATYSHNHNLDNRLANVNDKILELEAYQKSGMVARLSFMSAGLHMGSVLDIANSSKVKLETLIRDVDGFSSRVKAEGKMSMIELLRVKSSNVSSSKFLLYLCIN